MTYAVIWSATVNQPHRFTTHILADSRRRVARWTTTFSGGFRHGSRAWFGGHVKS